MKILFFLVSIVLLFPIKLSGQKMNSEVIVQKQLDAYNARNLSEFLSLYNHDIEIYNYRENEPFISGIEALREVYEDVFDHSPELNATIKNRIVFENKVIDFESVTGRKGVHLIEVIAIYEVKDNLIFRVTFIRKEQ